MGDIGADFDVRVLDALASWENTATGHDQITVEELTERLQLLPGEAHRVARSLKRLVDAGDVQAINVTAMGSPYPEYFVTGVSAAALRKARPPERQSTQGARTEDSEPTFL